MNSSYRTVVSSGTAVEARKLRSWVFLAEALACVFVIGGFLKRTISAELVDLVWRLWGLSSATSHTDHNLVFKEEKEVKRR
ncbi:hypothetical protein GUJ93_ZPchr0006g40650 [Zizania palustris]|uniref:Uncharacterized protein n=1 Tax=Zizania palustris TaxID=103762 RepID=A0A8J5VQ70_ZIZPA|nr:hypothetical protein GUJ93_ZPchr0006g40650 [Zizania palustris]